MRRHGMRAAICALSAGVVCVGGCVESGAAREVAGAQQQTITALASAYAADLALLNDLLGRVLAAQRVILLGELHREMLSRGYLTVEFEADLDRLRDDLGDASVANALVNEVRVGRMSAAQAEVFLVDYALSVRMSDGGRARDTMLARLAVVSDHDASSTALMGALSAHADDVGGLLEDADANARAIGEFAAFERDAGAYSEQTIRAIWDRAVLSGVDDAAERAAAERLIDRVLGMFAEQNNG